MKKGLLVFVSFAILFTALLSPVYAVGLNSNIGFAWWTPPVTEDGNNEVRKNLVVKYCSYDGLCEIVNHKITQPKSGESVLLILGTSASLKNIAQEYAITVREFNPNGSYILVAEAPLSFMGVEEDIKWSNPVHFVNPIVLVALSD